MIIHHQKITIIRQRRPVKKEDINLKLQWLGQSLGLFGQRDKDKSCYRIFVLLLKNSKNNKALTSDQIASKTNLSRGTVVHHLNRLIKSGIVVHNKNKYILRVSSLESLVEEIKKDMDRTLADLKQVARKIDMQL
ncbi:MAG: hypothetical protein MAG795_00843 [Candidatus Woesearchaeota archaeon]|nr:hypothetical protein [Candidatus Woesearchaeota archaeon]